MCEIAYFVPRTGARCGGTPTAATAGMGPTVLVADDDDVTVDIVAETMERLGFEVSRAGDGDEVLQKIAERGPFDLVITDISMPWMTGLQVAHSARVAGMSTPLIVMTALPIDLIVSTTSAQDAERVRSGVR